MRYDVGLPVQVGDVIDGKHRIDHVLGSGSMGIVVAATHLMLRERRAIKFTKLDMLGDAEGVARFMREAHAATRIKSPHAVKVHDVGTYKGCSYIVMEFLEGTDFRVLMERRVVLPVSEAVGYILQACEAIGEAHAAGIVHRDLKPANMFLTDGGRGRPCVKVLDFGIAKVSEPEGAGSPILMTSTGIVIGTPLYMSPEQMRSSRQVDARSDIWSLGVILYHFVTGRHPFEGETTQTLCAAVLRDPPAPALSFMPDLPRAFVDIIERCLQKAPAERYQSVAELAGDLLRFAPPPARPSYASQPRVVGAETDAPTQVAQRSAEPTRPGAQATESLQQVAPLAVRVSKDEPAAVPAGGPGAQATERWPGHAPLATGMPNGGSATGQTRQATARTTERAALNALPVLRVSNDEHSVGQTNAPWTQPSTTSLRRRQVLIGGLALTAAVVSIAAGALFIRRADEPPAANPPPDTVVPAPVAASLASSMPTDPANLPALPTTPSSTSLEVQLREQTSPGSTALTATQLASGNKGATGGKPGSRTAGTSPPLPVPPAGEATTTTPQPTTTTPAQSTTTTTSPSPLEKAKAARKGGPR